MYQSGYPPYLEIIILTQYAYIGNRHEPCFIMQQIFGQKSMTRRAMFSDVFKKILTSFAISWMLD